TDEITNVLHPPDVDSSRSGPFLAGGERIQAGSDPHETDETPNDEWRRANNGPHVRGIERTHRPARHQVTLIKVCRIVDEHDQSPKMKFSVTPARSKVSVGKALPVRAMKKTRIIVRKAPIKAATEISGMPQTTVSRPSQIATT